jgi:toxin ParE1/3/4
VKPLLVQPSAKRELRSATAWYAERNASVAERFAKEVRVVFDLIERFPSAGSWVPMLETPRIRKLPVHGFPYHVVFEELEDRVEILAIAHDRRKPLFWRK